MLEYLIVALLLGWSCYVVLRRFMPKTSVKGLLALALWLEQRGYHRLARWVKPTARQSGCSAGCSDCSVASTVNHSKVQCASDESGTQQQSEQPVQWR